MKQIELLARTHPEVFERVGERRAAIAPAEEEKHDEGVTLTSMGYHSSYKSANLDNIQADLLAEAIILEELRPAWLIKDDAVHVNGAFDRVDLFESNRDPLEKQAKMVGRVDLVHHATHDFVGTGWMIEKDVVCTNRHVAMVFAERDRLGAWDFAFGTGGQRIDAMLSFVRQQDTREDPKRRAFVTEIIYVSGSREADIAFLRVQPPEDAWPLELDTTKVSDETPCAVVGYPAWDGRRNDRTLMDRIFGGLYDVKRFAPGLAFPSKTNRPIIEADYSSLGGNSGSAVLSLETSKVIGLHFAGRFREANHVVPAALIASTLRNTRIMISATELPTETPTTPAHALSGREGYDPEFLGKGPLIVPMPGLGAHAHDIAAVEGQDDGILRYVHFSVIQNAKRKLPLLTAVNIDGSKARMLKREGVWRLDGRISPSEQVGNELYVRNTLDRGHLVRRMDPGWGDEDTAKAAEDDTFHYTNCAPQHEDLNQKTWLGLEEYVLASARTRGFKASVFTGPVFRDDDPKLNDRESIAIPLEYWKVVAMVNDETGKLSVTGYVLSQGELIRDITEAGFVYGRYETYQVTLARIAEATGLDFGALRSFDPLEAQEATGGAEIVAIAQPEDLVL